MLRAFSLLAVLSGCATQDVVRSQPAWAPVGYKGFVESIDALVGPAAVNCGFHNLVGRKPSGAERRQSYGCVQAALTSGVPFKYATERLPIDSYVTEVIARGSDEKLWFIAYDVMIDDSVQQQWNQTCLKVGVDPRTMFVAFENCVLKSEGILNIQ